MANNVNMKLKDALAPEGTPGAKRRKAREINTALAKAEKVKDQKEITRARVQANKTTAFGSLPKEERANYSALVQIVPDGRGYTAYQRIDAIFAYFVTGYIREAARLVNISENTLLAWAQSSWWKSAIKEVKEIKQEELDVQYTSILDKTIEGIADRLQHGDEKMTRDGPQRVKVALKDLMLVNAIAFDKRALLRRDPTEITHKVITVEDRNNILASQFRKIARQEEIVEGEIIQEAGIQESS